MKIIKKKLPNGLTVLMLPQPDAPTVTTLILVGAGSKYETKKESGLSHFLEHMYFKGTVARPSPRIISQELDALGAVSNAFTGHEYTGYYAKGNPSHIDTFIDVLSDIYLNSTFPEKEIEKEKGVIIEEINMYEDMPQSKVSDLMFSLMYGDQSAGWSIAGTKESVRSFSRKDFVKYQKEHYTAENTLVVIAGAVDPEKALGIVKKSFSAISKETPRAKKKVIDKQSAPQANVFTKKTDQAHISLGFRSVPLKHEDGAAVSLLSTILGGGMSSRLFVELREELGAAYYARAEQDAFTDHGIFSITAGIDKNRFKEIMKRIVVLLNDLKTNPVSIEELNKVKEYSLGMLRLGLESSDNIAGFYGMQLLLKGDYKTPEQLTKEYMKVTAEDIQRVAKKLFVAKNANLSVVGPFSKEVSAELLKDL
ncbi:MAG TPA: pitrilysin family protein [Candidatus Paceibacterota bacterium]|jgi:predicted Zn-dependent peptidase|nr:pitrilysin family protein [Candidatus Paceibacterota bacterium]